MTRKTKDFAAFRLSDEERKQLLTVQNECTVAWLNSDGWPVSAFLTYLFERDAFWVTSFRDRPRVALSHRRPPKHGRSFQHRQRPRPWPDDQRPDIGSRAR